MISERRNHVYSCKYYTFEEGNHEENKISMKAIFSCVHLNAIKRGNKVKKKIFFLILDKKLKHFEEEAYPYFTPLNYGNII